MRLFSLTVSLIVAGFAITACWNDGPQSDGIALPNCPGTAFSKQALVFDVLAICATSDVPDDKLAHAANVAAEWLDNDGDGRIDEPRLIPAMQHTQPFLVMTATGPSRALMREISPSFETRVGQDLAANETNPDGMRRDASQEEIHHLILNSGWKVAFPDTFLDAPDSEIYTQWALAEDQGHYNYNDPTCDKSCKVTEFFYLATAAYLGSDADLYSDEMRLKSRAALAKALPGTVAVMESDAYVYPTNRWPIGQYEYSQNIQYFP